MKKAATILLTIVVLFGALTIFSTSPVMAATLSIGDDTVTTDNGAITGVTVDLNTDITWDGAENEPGQTDVKLQVQNPDESWETLETQSTELSGLAGTYQPTFSNVDVTQSDWNNGDFRATGDGTTKETDLSFRLVVEASGNLEGDDNRKTTTVTSPTETATITAVNEANSNNAGGSGNVNGQGNDQNPSDNKQ